MVFEVVYPRLDDSPPPSPTHREARVVLEPLPATSRGILANRPGEIAARDLVHVIYSDGDIPEKLAMYNQPYSLHDPLALSPPHRP